MAHLLLLLRKLGLAATKTKGLERSTSLNFSETDWAFAAILLRNPSPSEKNHHQE